MYKYRGDLVAERAHFTLVGMLESPIELKVYTGSGAYELSN